MSGQVVILESLYCDNHCEVIVPHYRVKQLKIENTLTISCDIFPISDALDHCERNILSKMRISGHDKYDSLRISFKENSNRIKVKFQNFMDDGKTSIIVMESNYEVTLYKWLSIVLVITTNSVSLYLNGVLDTSSSIDKCISILNPYPFYFGNIKKRKQVESGNKQMSEMVEVNSFSGLIQHVTIHDYKLTGDQIKQISSNVSNYPPFTSSPRIRMEGKPLYSIEELTNWNPGNDPMNVCQVPLNERHTKHDMKMIHCHDMKGGYLDDRFCQGHNNPFVYNFTYWQYIDIFIYFSHYRVSIPPVGWSEAAHRSGVKILPTFITEWDYGEKECIRLLDGPDGEYKSSDTECSYFYADKLIEIAKYYRLDGWFLNIENPLKAPNYVKKMLKFVKYLTEKMHKEVPNSIVIWYDSVTINGELKWQNALNCHNEAFFHITDGLFLNYQWNPQVLEQSVALAKNRNYDIWTGIDIFDRGTYGGGKFNSHIALKEIQKAGTSAALFAPGWTFESAPDRMGFEQNEAKFWVGTVYRELLLNGNASEGTLKHWKAENSGDGWIVDKTDGYGGKSCFVSSFDWCRKSQTIDLKECNITPELLSKSPCFIVQEYVRGTGPNFSDQCYVKVELRDENHNVLMKFDSGVISTNNQWRCIQHQFVDDAQNTISKVRYVYYEDGGKDVEYWRGHFGARMCSSLLLQIRGGTNDQCSISTYFKEREIPGNLPFFTTFNQGIGNHFVLSGKQVSDKGWNNLRMQSVPLTFSNYKVGGDMDSLNLSISYEHAWDGGSSLQIFGKPSTKLGQTSFSRFRLYSTHFILKQNMALKIRMISRSKADNAKSSLLLSLKNDTCLICSERGVKLEKNVEEYDFNNEMEKKYASLTKVTKNYLDTEWDLYEFHIDSLLLLSNCEDQVIENIDLISFWTGNEIVEQYIGQIQIYNDYQQKEIVEAIEMGNWNSIFKHFKYSPSWNTKSITESEMFADINLHWKFNEFLGDAIEWINIFELPDAESSENTIFIGRTLSPCFVIQSVKFLDMVEKKHFIVEAVFKIPELNQKLKELRIKKVSISLG